MRSAFSPAHAALFLAGFLGALAVRLVSLNLRQVWVDEALTQFALSLDWRALIVDRLAAGHSPAYFLLLKGLHFDPADILPLRAASAVMDAAACAIIGAAIFRIRGARAAGFGMALYALAPLLIVWSQNARPYALLMLALAVGVYGATGLIAAAQDRRPARWDAVAMSAGLTVAALTLTAGAIAVLLVVLIPLARAPLREEPGAWLRAASLPLAAVALMAVLVSVPAAAVQSANHWTDRFAPFSPTVLADLARAMVLGDRFRPDEIRFVLGQVPAWWAAAVGLALFGAAFGLGLRQVRCAPSLLPFAVLAVGYPLLLLALSLSTSLLIPRYFLPALGPALMLAGVGLAAVRGRAGPWLCGATLVTFALFALNQSLMRGPQHRADLLYAADLILTDRPLGATVYRAPDEGLGFDLMAILLPRALGPHPDPRVVAASPKDLARALAGGGPAWLVTTPETWPAYRAALPPPDCLIRQDRMTFASWGSVPALGCD